MAPSFDRISLSYSFVTWLSSFFYEPSCAHIFSFLFNTLDLHVSIFFFFLYFCIAHVSSTKNIFRERHTFRIWSIYLVEMNGMFFAYFQCRSSIYMWHVRDLNIGSMINLSTRVNKIWQNSTQSNQLMSWKIIYGYDSNLSPWRNIKLFIFQKKTLIIILNWNKIIATLILLFHISQ
jgi:hypothetical protein